MPASAITRQGTTFSFDWPAEDMSPLTQMQTVTVTGKSQSVYGALNT